MEGLDNLYKKKSSNFSQQCPFFLEKSYWEKSGQKNSENNSRIG